MLNYEINIKDYEDKIDILRINGFHFTEDEFYKITYVFDSDCRINIFNKNILNQLIEILEQGYPKESDEAKSLYKIYEGDLWEFNKCKLNHGMSTNKSLYCTKSRHRKIREIISEDDEKVIFADIPNGEFSDGRPRKYTTYKSPEAVKKIALDYIENEINHLIEFREKIIREGV